MLCFLSSCALAQRELTTITVNYADAQQMVSVIRPYLSAGSSVSVYQNQLVLNATPEEVAKTRDLLQQLDAAGRQLLISVRTEGTGSASRRGVDVDGVITSGNTTITNGAYGRSSESRATVRVENYRGSGTDNGSQSVRATEGLPAYIGTGMTAPVQSYSTGPDGRRYYQQGYVDAVAGFYATTRVSNGVARISIDQSNDQLAGQAVRTQQLRSEVSGPLGQWLPLGSLNTAASQQGQDIGARAQSSSTGATQLFIKVDLLE
ncbi:MAG: secretin N-terminal domain-containing protein [Halioglobus sp.]